MLAGLPVSDIIRGTNPRTNTTGRNPASGCQSDVIILIEITIVCARATIV